MDKSMNEKKIDLLEIHNKMFDQNTETLDKDENMNREYLKQIYNGADMDFLPKETRLTRTHYYKMVKCLENEVKSEIDKAVKQLVIVPIILLCSILIFALFLKIAERYDNAYNIINTAYGDELGKIDTELDSVEDIDKLLKPSIGDGDKDVKETAKALRVASGVVKAVGWVIFCIGVTVFLFFTISSVKMIAHQRNRKETSLKRLENLKQEHMIMGTYDAEF